MARILTRHSVMAAIAAGAIAWTSAQAHAAGSRIIFATQESGTLYYALAVGFAKLLTEKLDRTVTVQPYSGSSVYLPLINSGEATVSFNSSLDAYAAYNDADREPLRNLRAVARIWPLKVAMMARYDSGIRDISDLKDKRVVVDLKSQRAMGSVIRAMLATGGVADNDVEPITVGNVGDGVKAVIEGNVDATFVAVGIPLVKSANAAIPGGVTYVDLSAGNPSAEDMQKLAPGVYPVEVTPETRLPEVKAALTTAAFDVFLMTGKDTAAADVEAVVSALHDNFATLQKDYPALGEGSAGAFASATNTVPYHDAAIAYYRSKGMWTPENEAREESFSK